MAGDDANFSDEEFEYESDGDDSEGAEDDFAIMTENLYYDAEEKVATDKDKAVTILKSVVERSRQRDGLSEWALKSLILLSTLSFQLGQSDAMMNYYQNLIDVIPSVPSNVAADSVCRVVDTICDSCNGHQAVDKAVELLQFTLRKIDKQSLTKLWLVLNIKLGNIFLKFKQMANVDKIVDAVQATCKFTHGTSDRQIFSAPFLESYSLQAQVYVHSGRYEELEAIYPQMTNLCHALTDSRSAATIKSCGGHLYLHRKMYDFAYREFCDSFKHCHDGGFTEDSRTALRFMALTSLLAKTEINPFDSRETRVHLDDESVLLLSELRGAFDRLDISEMTRRLGEFVNRWVSDALIAPHLPALCFCLRSSMLAKFIKPFKSVRIAVVAVELGMPEAEVQRMFVKMVLNGTIEGYIDGLNGVFHKKTDKYQMKFRTECLRWIAALRQAQSSLFTEAEVDVR